MRIAGALLGLLCENSELLLLKLRATLILKREEPGSGTLGIAADAPVVSAAAGWSEPVPLRQLHPLESSASHGTLLRQQSETVS